MDPSTESLRQRRLHSAFMTCAREEEEALLLEKAKYDEALAKLDGRLLEGAERLRALEAYIATHEIKAGNLRLDVKEVSDRAQESQNSREATRRENSKSEQFSKTRLLTLQELQRELDEHVQTSVQDKSTLAQASFLFEQSNLRKQKECKKAELRAYQAFVRWLKSYPLLHQYQITEDSLLLSYQKTASSQGLVAEWIVLRNLVDSFHQLCVEYSPVDVECNNLAEGQQQQLRNFNRFVSALADRTTKSKINAERLLEKISQLEKVRTTHRVMAKDLLQALEQDVIQTQRDAQEIAITPLTTQESDNEGDAVPPLDTLHTWQWCRYTDTMYSPQLEAIRAALIAHDAQSIESLFFLQEGRGDDNYYGNQFDPKFESSNVAGAHSCTNQRSQSIIHGLESRRVARDLQWAATVTAYEAIRKMTQAINSYKKSKSRALLFTTSSLQERDVDSVSLSEEALRRFFGYCEYIPCSKHLALALELKSFPCSPKVLVQKAAEASLVLTLEEQR